MFALMPWTRGPTLLPRVDFPDDDLGRLFDRFLSFPVMETPEWPNRWDVTSEENEKEFLIRSELPGFEPTEVKVEIAGDRLLVEAEHKPPEEEAEDKNERNYAHVKRTMTLPTGVNLEAVAANYRNGVLEVHIPRGPETLGRRIEVKT
jgi:HSP20 family protein